MTGLELWQWWQQARTDAIATNIPPEEADWLLQALTGLDRLALRLASFKEREAIALKVNPKTLPQLWQQRLEAKVPVQYLAGTAPWRNFMLHVSPAVLIPRPETERLIDLATAAVQGTSLAAGHWVDLGTGSGAIALGLAEAFPEATLHAVDWSVEALAIARLNAQENGLGDRIQFYEGSWFEPLSALEGNLSGMVSNPPYIPSSLIAELQPEVVKHEPHLALDGGADGLNAVRVLVELAPVYLKQGGLWLVELMIGQADEVANLLEEQGSYRDIEIHADLSGIERFVQARRR